MVYFLYGLFFISCIVLIATILLQPGKADAGALFTTNISSTAFGPRGTQSVLSRITITAAAVFMLTALMLSMPALTGNMSVLQTTSESSPTTTATPEPGTAQADTITNLNTNVQTNTGATNASQTTISNSSANPGSNANVNK